MCTALSVQSSDATFVYLRRLGKTVEYARGEGGAASLPRPRNTMDAIECGLRFLDEHLGAQKPGQVPDR